jgi:hypothetical protein
MIKEIKNKLNSIITIKGQIWYYTIVNFGINILRNLKSEIINMLIFFKICTKILLKINEHYVHLKKNHSSVINCLKTSYKNDYLLFLIKKFCSNLFFKSKIKKNEENTIGLEKKFQIRYFLRFLMKLKNLYKKNFGIKFKKKKKKLFIVYSNIKYAISSNRVVVYLEKKKEKKLYYIKTIHSLKKNELFLTLHSKSLTQLLIYTHKKFS